MQAVSGASLSTEWDDANVNNFELLGSETLVPVVIRYLNRFKPELSARGLVHVGASGLFPGARQMLRMRRQLAVEFERAFGIGARRVSIGAYQGEREESAWSSLMVAWWNST